MDKLRAIEVFRRVIELGSFKAAADDLNLSKAAISKNINELEQFLQTQLIQRTTRRLHITENGQVYYNQIKDVLDDLAYADLSVIESSRQLRGTLKISIPMSIGILIINPLVCDFMQSNPELSVEVLMSDNYLDLVEQGVDIAIRGGGVLKNSSLKFRKLIDIRRVVCASPTYLAKSAALRSPEDLQQHQCLVYSLSSEVKQWTFTKANTSHTIQIKPSCYAVNNGIGIKQAAMAGLGVTLTPQMLVQDALDSGELLSLLTDWQTDKQSLYAVYPYHKEPSVKVRAFIDYLIQRLTG